jgi:hypothetical protein
MNKLALKILDSFKGKIPDYMFSRYGDSLEEVSRIAAKICLEVAKDAYNAGCHDGAFMGTNEWDEYKQEIL